ncbi:hypothetical protein BH24CHL4_BH24CHL4_02660 [soil metagenome]
MLKQRRVLVSAYSCAPNRGSEPGIGWRWLSAIAKNNQVVLLVMNATSDEVKLEVTRLGWDSVTVIGHGIPIGEETIASIPFGRYIHYLAWQLTAIRKGKSLHKRYRFDLGHHVTFGSIRFPTFLAFIKIPYVLGPIGGAETMPHQFWMDMGVKDRASCLGRSLNNKLATYDPFVKLSLSRADVILATTPETKEWIHHTYRGKSVQIQAVGFEEQPTNIRPIKVT